MRILDLVRDKKARFVSYRGGIFIYETEDGFQFPVPADDIGSATLLAEDKALFFMRWIRKHLETKSGISNSIVETRGFYSVVQSPVKYQSLWMPARAFFSSISLDNAKEELC